MSRKMSCDLTAERLRELLHYEPSTGVFKWRVGRSGRAPAGGIAGTPTKNGYSAIIVDRTHYLAHRLAWLYVHGCWPVCLIDHRDTNKQNNRIDNLREASELQNQHNRPHAVGVYLSRNKTFRTSIRIDGKSIDLGTYKTWDLARAAYVAARNKYFGEFAPSGGQIAGGNHPSAASPLGAQ